MKITAIILFLTLALFTSGTVPAEASEGEDDHAELYLYSDEDGSGALTTDYHFEETIHLEETGCAEGTCTFASHHPGFVTADEGQHVPDGLFFVDNDSPFRTTLVNADPGVSLNFDGIVLDTPGQFINLGFSPFHADLEYQVEAPEGEHGKYEVTVRFSNPSDRYDSSADYTLMLTNEEDHHETTSTSSTTLTTFSTTSTTLLSVPVCGDSTIDAEETCDDGDTQWAPGLHCRGDCSTLACGENPCDTCICDANGNAAVTAADALILLQLSIGGSAPDLACPACQ